MDEKLKLAFIGGGVNSAVGSVHYSAINIDNHFELVAGCFSRRTETNRLSAEKYRIQAHKVYENIDDLIEKEKNNIDAMVVLTPSDQHPDQVKKLLSKNIPVICEKSLTGSLSEALEINNLIKQNNGFLVVIYNYLGYPMIRELKNLITKGDLGKINHIEIEMPQESFIRINPNGSPKNPQPWRLKDDNVATISLDLGIHLHMFIKYLTNETPLNVVARCDTFGNFEDIVDNINCLIEYTNGVTCNMWYSKIAIGNRNGLRIRIFGSKGSAEWVQEYPEILNLADSFGRRWKIDRGNDEVTICNQHRYTRFKVGHPAGFVEAFANYYQDIAIALNDYKKNGTFCSEECFGVSEAQEGIKLLEAIQISNKLRSWVKL